MGSADSARPVCFYDQRFCVWRSAMFADRPMGDPPDGNFVNFYRNAFSRIVTSLESKSVNHANAVLVVKTRSRADSAFRPWSYTSQVS